MEIKRYLSLNFSFGRSYHEKLRPEQKILREKQDLFVGSKNRKSNL